MKIEELMTPVLYGIDERSAVRDAAVQMARHAVGVLPVFSKDTVVGVITDRDIALRLIAQGRNPLKTPVANIMSRHLVTISASSSLEQAAELMGQQQVRRLLVINQGDQVVGILSLGDLARVIESQLSAQILHVLSLPAEPNR
jgi:CBS domain-containing protein